MQYSIRIKHVTSMLWRSLTRKWHVVGTGRYSHWLWLIVLWHKSPRVHVDHMINRGRRLLQMELLLLLLLHVMLQVLLQVGMKLWLLWWLLQHRILTHLAK